MFVCLGHLKPCTFLFYVLSLFAREKIRREKEKRERERERRRGLGISIRIIHHLNSVSVLEILVAFTLQKNSLTTLLEYVQKRERKREERSTILPMLIGYSNIQQNENAFLQLHTSFTTG